ncbi:MAG: DUF349 domain-containing protein [Bacteroidales bacterium]|nr:DUF349 domain-containing protein [Bacteroidales bacterium]
MVDKKPQSSVHEEQYGDVDESAGNKMQDEIKGEEPAEEGVREEDPENNSPSVDELNVDDPQNDEETELQVEDEVSHSQEEVSVTGSEEEDHKEENVSSEIVDKSVENHENEDITDNADDEADIAGTKDAIDEETEESTAETEEKPEKIDYAALSKEDLVAILKEVLDKGSMQDIIHDVDTIKIHFYKKHKADIEKKRKKFYEEGGAPEDFKAEEDPVEKTLKEYLTRFREYKAEYTKQQEVEKQKNLEEKYKIIEEIKDLVNRKESINKTFHEFRELQRRWRETGPVPQSNLKDLWETYHHHVETFYDYIKINQELRDLDLKKNFESKITLCEKADELLLEPNVVIAFNTLQTLHEQWREIGPVPVEMRTEIWKRFKETTSKINKRHQDFFLNLKQEQKNNLEAKTALCEKAEEIANGEIESMHDWEKASRDIIELQKVWRAIGFAPKKDNAKIYKRFREACDSFFNRKREFFSTAKQEQNDNLQLKTELCIQAEALSESSEWKKTTEDLIALQKRWKDIGPVPYKYSDKIWKRFRSACDKFFERKSQFFATVDDSYESNLKKKEELIEKINRFEPSSNVEENLKMLREFQREWAAIGFVPFNEKDKIQTKYREALNHKFDDLKIDDGKKDLLKFKTRLDSIQTKPNHDYRVLQERDKFISRLKQLESDIVLWENNIGFFAKSKNAESMIKEVQRKIDDAKNKIRLLTEKIKMIEDMYND